MKRIKNLPNQLTLSRIVLIFFFVLLANVDAGKINFVTVSPQVSDVCHVSAYIVAVLAGLTDLFDGLIARRYRCESDFGRLMDPLADKIFIAATYIMMVDYRIVPAWVAVVILTREFLVTGLRLLAAGGGVVIAADKSGKFKTMFQIGALLIAGAGWIRLGGFNIFEPVIWKIWYGILMLVTLSTVYSGGSYFIRNYKLLRNKF